MQQEFLTVYGKVILEGNKVFIRSLYLPFTKTAFARISYLLLWIAVFVVQFFREEGPAKYLGILIWGLLLLFRLPDIIDVFFKRSYASRIPLDKIKTFSVENDQYGIQTVVRLDLKNGRYKKILFRSWKTSMRRLPKYFRIIFPFLNLSD